MGAKFIEYVSTNSIEVIIGTIFCLLGVLLSILSGGKKEDVRINNSTSIIEMKTIVHNNYNISNNYHSSSQNRKFNSSSSSSEDDLWGILGICFLAGVLYAKYHSLIMTGILLYSLFALMLVTIIAVKLSRNNQLDSLNKHWIVVSIGIIFYDFISLFIMYQQNIDTSSGISGLARIFTYFAGVVVQIIPNAMILVILIYLLSLNLFLIKPNRVNELFVRKLNILTDSHKGITVLITVLICLSIFFSSGAYFNLMEMISYSSSL